MKAFHAWNIAPIKEKAKAREELDALIEKARSENSGVYQWEYRKALQTEYAKWLREGGLGTANLRGASRKKA